MARQKQYVALRSYTFDGYKWDKFELIRLEEDEALPYVAQRILMPFATAVDQGVWPPPVSTKKILDSKTKADIRVSQEENKAKDETSAPAVELQTRTTGTKQLITNKLRDAIQQKKSESSSPDTTNKKVSADKLASIKSGGKK